MIPLFRDRFITESEGDAPAKSQAGQILLHFRSLLSGQNYLKVANEKSGVHPSSPFFKGLGGESPHGVATSYSLVPRGYYQGIYPISQQPRLNKPFPWLP